MELREWQYMNKPTGSAASNSSSSSAGNKSFKKRFDKLIQYYGDHLPKEIDFVYVNLLTKDTLDFTENFSDGDKVRFNITINPATEAWTLKYYVNDVLTDTNSDTGWTELLKTLYVGYIDELPQVGTPEYNNLLTEWVAMNNKTNSTSSSGYKKRFEKLIKYHIDHASSELESITTKDIKPYGFHLSEHYNDGHDEFDRDIVASANKTTGILTFGVFMDGKEVCRRECKDYEEFVKELGDSYMFLPDTGTLEHDDLLVEWVTMKNNSSQPASSTKGGYWERFNRLLYYHVRHKGPGVDKVIQTKVSKDGFRYTEHRRAGVSGYDYGVIVNIDPATESWTLQTYMDSMPHKGGAGDGYLELLKELRKYMKLPNEGTNEYDDLLTESISSIADDFKTYENLWD